MFKEKSRNNQSFSPQRKNIKLRQLREMNGSLNEDISSSSPVTNILTIKKDNFKYVFEHNSFSSWNGDNSIMTKNSNITDGEYLNIMNQGIETVIGESSVHHRDSFKTKKQDSSYKSTSDKDSIKRKASWNSQK